MAIQYNTEYLGKFFAPGISDFTVCDAADLSHSYPQAAHWLTNHFLNALFRSGYKNKYRQYAINQMHRAQVAFADYHEARDLTLEFLARGSPDNPASKIYFRALARWESCLLNLQIFIDVMNKMKTDLQDDPVFKKADGTPAQRAYSIANTVKHWGEDIFAGRHEEADTVPLWLTNGGLKTRKTELTYSELTALVSEVAAVADKMQNPDAFAVDV
jgi:hypothetical protein